ncbi:pilus assembly protein PilM [Ruminococcus albus]|jgi:type IV pilus assembly protein PilM|uniref:Conserved domain protein n=1 Tax=Ruminococcus albus 8 TaxID=246199 RepID=E9SAK0_RUMAL|nr:pilus assembly protein PilM [Ruminococcus albus]EGC03515.1 conserved domain protein [Ruminococcus albus 8]MCC3349832.1 pilus assembly protein PilM [Ruminococcus albus 8]
MLSFDFSDRQINIVKGDNTANKIRIDNSTSVMVPEDMIVNGEVIQLSGLSELLLTQLRSEQMMDRDAIVTFSSSNIVFKELIVPKAKGAEFLQMVQNHMSQEMGISNEYSISYTVVGEAGEDNPGAVKVLATACPSSIVEGFRKLFAVMNINLRSVNIGCNSIARIVLADKSNADKMPLLVCQLDNNFLGLTLFENGQMAFARYVPISPDEYDADDYVLEALNENIFRMEQFNKARGGSGLANVILYGFIDDYMKIVDALDGLDIKASVLGTPAQITGYENFEFTVFANAIGALYRRNKQTERINLLEVDRTTSKEASSGISSMLTTAGILAAASAILIAAVYGFISLRASGIDKETEKVEAENAKLEAQVKANEVLHNRLEMINTYKNYVKTVQLDIDTLPQLTKDKFDKIQEVIDKHEATYTDIAFDLNNGAYTISPVTVKEKEEVKKLVDDLKAIDFVANVDYYDYRVVEPQTKGDEEVKEEDKTIQISNLVLYFMEEGE